MYGIFSSYKVALIDSSFYFRPFSDELRSALKGMPVYVGKTFRDDVQQISKVLSSSRRPVYEENLQFLIREIELKYINRFDDDEKTAHLQNDTWGMLNLMASIGSRFVLVTADRLLINRVILTDVRVDIFDLSSDSFIYYSDFRSLRRDLVLDNRLESAVSTHDPIRQDSILYRRNGTSLTLGAAMNDGGAEGVLYTVKGHQELIAKVYRSGKLPVNKLENLLKLEGINDVMEISWAIFPQDILYYDKDLTIPVGFSSRFVRTLSVLGDDPLYTGDLPSLTPAMLDVPISQTLMLVLKVVRQVRYLNQYGFYVSDYNTCNFSYLGNSYDLLQMWDTDSFGYEGYFSGYTSGDRLGREYDVTQKMDAIALCNEALYVFAFRMLALGDPPLSERKGTFKYDNPEYPNHYRISMIPDNLWNLFEQVFHQDKEPSVEMLLHELTAALDSLNKNPSQNPTYQKLIDAYLSEDDEDDEDDEDGPGTEEPPSSFSSPVQPPVPPINRDDVGGYEQVPIKWGTANGSNSRRDSFKSAPFWIAGILCAAAAALAVFLFR